MDKLKVSIVAEKFVGQANGVYTAIVQVVNALKEHKNIDVLENANPKEVDVIHAHTIGLNYILTAMGNHHKTIVSAHVVPDSFIGSLIFSRLWQPLAKAYLKFAFNRAKLVIAVSPVVKEELQKIGVKTRIEVLCNSVNRSRFKVDPIKRNEVRKKLNIPEDAFVATCVGQIQPRKGVFDFIEAARKCPDITFVWVGGRPYGRLTEDYDRLTKEVENAPKNIIWAGIIDFDQMPAYYAMSDCYFLPSLQENFAFATIEASAVNLPLVLRDNKEYPGTLFTHYLKGKNADEFAQIISKLSTDSEFMKKWQAESEALATKFELKNYMKTLIGLYTEIANQGK